MKKLILSIIMCLLLLPMVMAASLNDSIIEGGTNTNITINDTIYFGELIIGSSGIYFENLTLSVSSTEKITFNITESNGDYYVNETDYDLPYFSSSSTSSKTITSALNESVNGSIIISYDSNFACSSGDNVGYLGSIVVGSTTFSEPFTCNGGVIELDGVTLSSGNTSIALTYIAASTSACNNFLQSIGDSFGLAAIILIILAVGAIFMIMQGQGVDIKLTVMTIMLGGLMLLIGFYLIAKTSGAVC